MTEEEARKRACPFARVKGGENRFASYSDTQGWRGRWHTGTECIASDCMAWSWDFIGNTKSTTEGCCGLAR